MKKLYRLFADRISEDITGLGSVSAYLLVSVFFLIYTENELFIRLLLALVLAIALVALIRTFYFKDRPLKERYSGYFERLLSSYFPSLHTARVAALFFLIWWANVDTLLAAVFLVIFALVAISRIILKRHDIYDVLGGALLGFVIALICQGLF